MLALGLAAFYFECCEEAFQLQYRAIVLLLFQNFGDGFKMVTKQLTP